MPECQGKPNGSYIHPRTTMIYVKSWTIQGQHQKKPITVELWKCPLEGCRRIVRKQRKT